MFDTSSQEQVKNILLFYSFCAERTAAVEAEAAHTDLSTLTEKQMAELKARKYIAHTNQANAAIRLADFMLSKINTVSTPVLPLPR